MGILYAESYEQVSLDFRTDYIPCLQPLNGLRLSADVPRPK